MSTGLMDEVESRLYAWSKYQYKYQREDIGYPPQSAICNIGQGLAAQTTFGSVPLLHCPEQVQQTDHWLKLMGIEFPELFRATFAFYCLTGKPSDIAREIGISTRTLYQLVREAKHWICGSLRSYYETIEREQNKFDRSHK